MGMGDYYAAKDAENEYGEVDWNKVPRRFGGKLVTDHPEDHEEW